MLPLIYTNPTAGAVFIICCLVWLLPETIGMFHQMAQVSRKETAIQDHASLEVLIGLQWIGLALNFWLAGFFPAGAIPWQRTVLFGLSLIFILSGVALRWFAIRTLGRYFTRDVAVSSDQQVVEHGPYRWVRHPSYSGTILTMLGVGLAASNWASLICLLACVLAGHLYRVRIEERALVHAIGRPYIEYMRRTRRFIPFLF